MSKSKPASNTAPAQAADSSVSLSQKRKSASANSSQHPPPKKRQKMRRTTTLPNPPRPRRGIPPLSPSITSAAAAASSSTGDAHPLPTASGAAAAALRLQQLHATTTLLHALHARNRNQHRAQLWFTHAARLGRQLARLLALEVALFELRYDAAATTVLGRSGGGRSQAEEARWRFEREAEMEERRALVVRWIRERGVPGAWVGAGSVVADGQFAGVGLVLVGVLADVRGLVGGPAEEVECGGGTRGSTEKSGLRRALGEADDDDGVQGKAASKEDVGEVVQRRRDGAISGTQTPEPQVDLVDLDVLAHEATVEMQEPRSASSPFAAFEDEDDDALPTNGEKESKREEKRNRKDKAKDKNSATKARTKEKKKKKGTGNAIDDLFAGFG